ncbi:MAG: DUF4860 domain-containing protein [Eubacterium sp.]|nr:DUF4860 domain-containing protein [Eubacterium sp.]
MKFATSHKHVIDMVFPIAVFFVFAASALAVLTLCARFYRSQTTEAESHYMTRTSLAYVSEKIRQNDKDGGISVETVEDQECLTLQSKIDGISYTTYIYAQDGMLKELFIRDDADLHLKDGTEIMEIGDFTMEEIDRNLFRFTSIDKNGNTSVLTASERSMP